jgi:DNA repair photolyase
MSTIIPAPDDLPASLREVVDYRKSGLSLNHIVGCPLDCGYCVRHLFGNFEMKRPHLVMDDRTAVDALVNHWAFRQNATPIQIFNRATDPFLPGVKDHLFATLEEMDRRALTNPVLVITRWKVDTADVERLDRLAHPKLTVLITWSGIDDDRIEPVDSSIAEASLQTLHESASRTKKILYWRPLIAGINDTPGHLPNLYIGLKAGWGFGVARAKLALR